MCSTKPRVYIPTEAFTVICCKLINIMTYPQLVFKMEESIKKKLNDYTNQLPVEYVILPYDNNRLLVEITNQPPEIGRYYSMLVRFVPYGFAGKYGFKIVAERVRESMDHSIY